MTVRVLPVKPQKKQKQERFKAVAGYGGIPPLKAMSLPRSGPSRDGRKGRKPGATLHPRFTPPEAGVERDVLRHRGLLCAAGGWNRDEVSLCLRKIARRKTKSANLSSRVLSQRRQESRARRPGAALGPPQLWRVAIRVRKQWKNTNREDR